jgi:uroporphyrinogen-III decarboxylase
MNGRERLDVAMRLGTPDRVPVMCQLALGHYFLRSGLDAIEVWHDTEAFAEALVRLRQRYGFDGILVNLPGRDPDWRRHVGAIEETSEGRRLIRWRNGWWTEAPPDDNPHVLREDGQAFHPRFEDVDPDRLYYVEPHDLAGITYPHSWDFGGEPAAPGDGFFPPWHCDTLRRLVERAGAEVSIHGEVFSPFSQMLELLGVTNGLMALMDDAGKLKACLEALSAGTIALARLQIEAGARAVLISSAYAGAGLLSRRQYEEFVLPYERRVIEGLRQWYETPVYTHTCGAIGDRLDLLMASGTNGIDTLDPPPLGTVELAEAKRLTAGRVFLKGNLDPVHTLLRGTREDVVAAARERIATAGPGGGYVLSSACSVPPSAPPENIAALREVAETEGRYPLK